MLNGLSFYRRLRGGIWLLVDHRVENRTFWKRFSTLYRASEYAKEIRKDDVYRISLVECYETIYDIDEVQKIVDISLTGDKGFISDGYHSFNELYAHRNRLFILLMRMMHAGKFGKVWKSKKNADGSSWSGWFVGGFGEGYVTYHMPEEMWDDVDVPVLERLKGLDKLGGYRVRVDRDDHV